ncbi:MAG: LOG family protein [Pseudomonas sp.]|uniref:LOG family protein n=1 Tax=Pseudomonas sp. TaxID=306 RepID=UPI003D14766D
MPYEADDYLSRHFQTSGIDLTQKVDELTALVVPPTSPNLPLYRDMFITVIRMAQADRNRWDAKIMLQTLREMERAFATLEQFKRRRKVTVFGSARTPPGHPVYELARELGATLARYDLMTITGAGGGIMAAAHEGAGRDNSLGFNIALPFEQGANATMQGSTNLLSFHFFFLRKLFFVKEADALVLCPGGFGTLDEAVEVLTLIQTGKSPLVPVVLLDQPGGTFWQDALAFIEKNLLGNHYILPGDMQLMHLVYSAEDAAAEIANFYSNYHSSRWLQGLFVLRLNHPLSEMALKQLDETFGDLCKTGGFQQRTYSEAEKDEPEFDHLTRLAFAFHGRDYGRLRALFNYINQEDNWAANG